MANIHSIEPLKVKGSWLHCDLCGADDQEAADWLITIEEFRDKYHPKKVTLKICSDCLDQIGEALSELQQIKDNDERFMASIRKKHGMAE